MRNILVIGAGYSGRRLALHHARAGDRVIVTSRSGDSTIAGLETLALDLDTAVHDSLPGVDRVYYTAPPPPAGQRDTRLARCLPELPPPAEFVYFGTTGVYGQRHGEIVSETTPPAPASDRARRRLDAERQLETWSREHRVLLSRLRIAGIYGPGRLPLERLARGEPVADPAASGPGNRIHVDDLISAAVAIADSRLGGAWNLADGNPLSTAEFSDLVADAAGLPRPRRVALDSPEISPGMRGFLAESRRIDNARLLSLPGFRLRYADPADGIRQSITK